LVLTEPNTCQELPSKSVTVSVRETTALIGGALFDRSLTLAHFLGVAEASTGDGGIG
jgi:hypothetical protein